MNHTKGQVYPDGTVAYYKDAKAREMISTDYDSTASYAVGDYCMYDNVRYCCNTAIGSGGETWNSSHWDEVKVDDDVTEIKQSLSVKTVSDLFSINSAFSSIFEITNQSAYRVGNIVYFYLEMHRVGNITVGEHDIAQVSVTPKIPCTAIPFSNDFSMLVQTSKNVKLSTNSAGRAWYTLTGYILVD